MSSRAALSQGEDAADASDGTLPSSSDPQARDAEFFSFPLRKLELRLHILLSLFLYQVSVSNTKPDSGQLDFIVFMLPDSTRIERSWLEYFRNPSQWWDIRKNKTNPRAPDFKHKITKHSLWLDGRHNPGWVQERLEEKDSRSKAMYWGKASGGQGLSNSACPALMEELAEDEQKCIPSLWPGVREDASTAQQLQERMGWEMLSVEEALGSLERIAKWPSVETLICILEKCRKSKKLTYTKCMHIHICSNGLEANSELGNYLVQTFVECGGMFEAQSIFNGLVHRNEYAWTSLIQGYNDCGESQHALNLFQNMLEDQVHPSRYTFVAILKSCGRLKCMERGREIHAEIAKDGFERDLFVGNTLVDIYAKCGSLAEAREVLDRLSVRDVVSWTALISGYTEHGLGEEALNCLDLMQLEGVSPNAITCVSCLKACSITGAVDRGREIHIKIAKEEFEGDLFVGSILVDMYAKFGLCAEARDVFGKLSARDVVLWNTLIMGYAEHGLGEEAFNCLERMQVEGVSPNSVTFVGSLKACGSIGAVERGREIDAEIVKEGFEREPCVGSTLVDMYAKCGSLAEAEKVFDNLPVRDVVSWTVLMAGYAEHGLGEESLDCLERMQLDGVFPNAITLVCGLKACGSIGAIERGQKIHAGIAKQGYQRHPFYGSTLVDMYAKCGLLAEAWVVFNQMPVQDVVSWTSIIAGYAHRGESELVFHLFERMQEEGIEPNSITFLSVLTVCSHAGLVDVGHKCFEAMAKEYDITPSMEHHNCMVDLLGRAGQLDDAEAMLEKMPFQPDLVTWNTVLAACRKWCNVDLGRQAFECAVRLDEKYSAAFFLMSNIYAVCDMWEDVKKIDAMNLQAWKDPGKSLIEVGGIMHAFMLGDIRHPQSKDIYTKLKQISVKMKEERCVPDLNDE